MTLTDLKVCTSWDWPSLISEFESMTLTDLKVCKYRDTLIISKCAHPETDPHRSYSLKVLPSLISKFASTETPSLSQNVHILRLTLTDLKVCTSCDWHSLFSKCAYPETDPNSGPHWSQSMQVLIEGQLLEAPITIQPIFPIPWASLLLHQVVGQADRGQGHSTWRKEKNQSKVPLNKQEAHRP